MDAMDCMTCSMQGVRLTDWNVSLLNPSDFPLEMGWTCRGKHSLNCVKNIRIWHFEIRTNLISVSRVQNKEELVS